MQRITARALSPPMGDSAQVRHSSRPSPSWGSATAAALAAPFRWVIFPYLPALYAYKLRKFDPFDGPPLTLPIEGREEMLLGLFQGTLEFYSVSWHLLTLLALGTQLVAAGRGELRGR